MDIAEYIKTLTKRGQYHFTTTHLSYASRGNLGNSREQIEALIERGVLASPASAFFVIVAEKYREQGCPPADHFIDPLMRQAGVSYYLCLRSAAQRYGARSRAPVTTQVMVNRKREAIQCGDVQIEFIVRPNLKRQPRRKVITPRGEMFCSTPELTALDLVGYPAEASGMANIAALLRWLQPELCPIALDDAARVNPPAWSQRLGYVLEVIGATKLSNALMSFLKERPRSDTPLLSHNSVEGANYIPKWKLLDNSILPAG